MAINKIWNKKKTWIVIGAVIGFLGGFASFSIMVIQHSHQVRGVM